MCSGLPYLLLPSVTKWIWVFKSNHVVTGLCSCFTLIHPVGAGRFQG